MRPPPPLSGRLARLARSLLGRSEFVVAPPTASERRRAYEADGFVAGGPLLGADDLPALRREFERCLAEGVGPDCHRIAVGAERAFFKVYRLTQRSRAFEDLARHPRLVDALADLTGVASFRLLLDQVQYKPPRTGGRNAWHRDAPSFPLAPPYTGLTAWIALDDATVRTGCMKMVPGSHAWGDAADLAVEGDGWGLPGVEDLDTYRGHEIRIVERPVRAGDVHFHHERVWHASGRNVTRHKRRALAIHFVGASDRYRATRWTSYPELADGDPLDLVAPLVVRCSAPVS